MAERSLPFRTLVTHVVCLKSFSLLQQKKTSSQSTRLFVLHFGTESRGRGLSR